MLGTYPQGCAQEILRPGERFPLSFPSLSTANDRMGPSSTLWGAEKRGSSLDPAAHEVKLVSGAPPIRPLRTQQGSKRPGALTSRREAKKNSPAPQTTPCERVASPGRPLDSKVLNGNAFFEQRICNIFDPLEFHAPYAAIGTRQAASDAAWRDRAQVNPLDLDENRGGVPPRAAKSDENPSKVWRPIGSGSVVRCARSRQPHPVRPSVLAVPAGSVPRSRHIDAGQACAD